MTTNRIIEQIKKLLTLADLSRGATIEEAAIAAAKAQGLLFKYNLTMAEVRATGVDVAEDAIDMRQAELGGAGRGWRRLLLHHVAEANFCRTMAVRGAAWNQLIGKPHNMDVAQYLYAYLVGEVWSCWKRREKQFRKRSRARYCYGCVLAIAETLVEQRRRDESASADSRALVVREDRDLAAAALRLAGPAKQSQAGYRKSRSRALEQGFMDGKQIQIRKGLIATPESPKLGHITC